MTATSMKRVAVVAPHPDDEVLGCGGTMARLISEGVHVEVVVVTRGQPPRFTPEFVDQVRRETLAAHSLLGVANTRFLDFPAAELDQLPQSTLNAALEEALAAVRPDTVFIPFLGDIHADHQAVFNAALVHARPRSSDAPSRVFAYETLSETNWWAPGITPGFLPNVFIDISDTLEKKLAAFALFQSQVKAPPDERSPQVIRALAQLRGATVFRDAAEAFMLVRQII
ncbi:PIG-L deacetylase family protein [Novosphingobium sp. M1R2S20]|uniref:PIG-L deacetylase family protein n=1 Tax=Novosphingobium rhizovicinum TaxID=3228928 RepID=A0ABV3RG22_9SPHN